MYVYTMYVNHEEHVCIFNHEEQIKNGLVIISSLYFKFRNWSNGESAQTTERMGGHITRG